MNTQQQFGRAMLTAALGVSLLLSGCTAEQSVRQTPSPTITAPAAPASTAIYDPSKAAIANGDTSGAALHYLQEQTPERCAALAATVPGLHTFDTGDMVFYQRVRDEAAAAARSCAHALDAASVAAVQKLYDSTWDFALEWGGYVAPPA